MRRLTFPLIVTLVIYFTFFGGSLYTLTNFPLKVINHLIVTVILGLWLWRKVRRPATNPFPHTPLDGALAFWLAVQLISAAFSLYHRFSYESLWQPIMHALAFYLLLDLRPTHGQSLVRAIYLSSAVVCLVGLMEFLSWYFGWPLLPQFEQSWFELGGLMNLIPPYWYRINFTLNGATSLSAYLALLIPPALAMWLTTRKRDDRQTLAAWLILALAVEFLTFSRGGILALGVSLSAFCLIWFQQKSPALMSHWMSRIPKGAIIAGLGVILVIGFIGLGLIQQRITTHGSGDQVRLSLWRSAVQMALDHPLLGVGPKLYGRALRTYRDPALARDQITTAHNLYLNTAAETGIIGLLAGGWLIGAFILAAWRNWQATSSTNQRIRMAGVAAALLGFGAQNGVDTFNATQIMLPVLLGGAYLLSPHQVSRATGDGFRYRWRPLAMLLLLLGYSVVLVRWDIAQFHFQQGSRLAQQGNFAQATTHAERALTLDPTLTLYQFEVAYYLSRQATTDATLLQPAIETYQTALHTEGTNPNYHANLAGLLAQSGDIHGAIIALENALHLSPKDTVLLLNLGHLREQAGDQAGAIAAYAGSVIQLPDLLDTGLWPVEEQTAIEQAIEQQTEDPLLLSQVALMRGDYHQAELLAEEAISLGADHTQAVLALLHAYRGQQRYLDVLDTLQREFPKFGALADGELYRLRGEARWLAHGETAAAIRDLKIALFISPGANVGGYHTLGQIYESQGDIAAAKVAYAKAVPPEYVSQNYDVVVYGRSSRHLPLGPQLLSASLPETSLTPWQRLYAIYQSEGNTEKMAQIEAGVKRRYPYLLHWPPNK